MTNLTELRAAHNRIAALPDEIGLLKFLTQMFISDNLIAGLPQSFGKLSSLRLLDLSYNRIPALTGACLEKLSSLVSLNLLKNEIAEISADVSGLMSLAEIGALLHAVCDAIGAADGVPSLCVLLLSLFIVEQICPSIRFRKFPLPC